MRHLTTSALLAATFALAAPAARAQTGGPGPSDADFAKKLANPVASLMSVPFQLNYNQGFAPEDGDQTYLNIQPVIPFSIAPEWNVISRTILPVISQDDVAPEFGSQFGLGTTTQSFFFSPKEPTATGIVWGVGPAFLIPTATDSLATNQWGAGVTGLALRQTGPWTYGVLANHLWSVTGDSSDGDISNTFLQPFVNYTTPSAMSFALNTETIYNWEAEEWSVPINATVAQLVKIGEQRLQLAAGLRYWADSPEFGPQDWGGRLAVTFLFPTK